MATGTIASITIDPGEIDKAVKPHLDAWLEVHKTDTNREIGTIKDTLSEKKREVTDDLTALHKQVDEKRREIDKQFEDLKSKIEKRAAYILIPLIAVIFLVVAAGVVMTVWSPLMSVASGVEAMRVKSEASQKLLVGLDGEITARKGQIADLDTKIKQSQDVLNKIKDATALQAEVTNLQGALAQATQRIDAIQKDHPRKHMLSEPKAKSSP